MKTDLHSPAITPTAPDMVDIIGRYRKLSTNVVYDVMDEEGLRTRRSPPISVPCTTT